MRGFRWTSVLVFRYSLFREYNFKVPMKWNLFLSSFKIYLVKYAIPKFETSGVKSNDFTSLQSWAILPSKMVFESRGQIPRDTNLWRHFGAKIVLTMADRKEKRKREGDIVQPVPQTSKVAKTQHSRRVYECMFPSDPAVRAKWVQFVRRHRHGFEDLTSNTLRYIRHILKSRPTHFEESTYKQRARG